MAEQFLHAAQIAAVRSRCVAKEWRSACGVARSDRPRPAAQVSASAPAPRARSSACRGATGTAPIAGAPAKGQIFDISVDRFAHGRQHRHDALLAALAENRAAYRRAAHRRASDSALRRCAGPRRKAASAAPCRARRSIRHRSRPLLRACAWHRFSLKGRGRLRGMRGVRMRARRADFPECSRARDSGRSCAPRQARAAHRAPPRPSLRRKVMKARMSAGASLASVRSLTAPPTCSCRKVEEPRAVVAIGAQRVRAGAALMGKRRQPIALQIFGRSSHARIARSSARAKKARSASASSPSKRPSLLAPST